MWKKIEKLISKEDGGERLTKFHLKVTLLNFWIKLTQKGYFRTKKDENYHRILHIQINVDSNTKKNCDFLEKFFQKG